ncbi:inorganic diphosphatase [Candidatus Parcubacteria bacterium]|nr:inorganic diphosphatase [Candidatus Parcubacteria bacterium]
MNLWHDVDPGNEKEMTTVIEINRGSKNKYEVDKETGQIFLDRVLHTAQDFPFDYGFVPQTLWGDGDPLDVIVLTTYPLSPGILIKVRPLAIMHMIDSGESDDKIIAVPVKDPRWDATTDLKDVNKHTLREIEHFYSTYKMLQNKVVKVNGFEGKNEAEKAFAEGRKLYVAKFKK